MIKAILKPFKFIFQALKSVVMLPVNLIKFVIDKVWAVVKYVLNLVWKIVLIIWTWLIKAFVETLNQLWTLLGMFAAWLVLEGSAKTIVGYSIILVLFVWLITMGIREGGEE